MKKYCINSICLLIHLLISFGFAQNYHSKNISVKDGLPSNYVYDVLKSNDDAIWVSTEAGVSSIKGKEVNNYTVKQGLPHNNCWQIIEDGRQQIWVGTFGGGVAYLDGTTFKKIDKTNGLRHNNVRKLYYYKNQVFVGTQKGLSIINTETKQVSSKNLENFTFQVMDFFEYENSIYVVTYRDGIYKLNDQNVPIKISTEGGLFSAFVVNNSLILSKDGNTTSRPSIHTTKIDSLNLNQTNFKTFGTSVFWDFKKYKNTLFGSAWGVNFETGGLFEVKDSSLVSLNKKYDINSKSIYSLFLDEKTNQLLVATLDNGIYIIDLETPFSKFETNELLEYKQNHKKQSFFLHNEYLDIKTENLSQTINKNDFISFINFKLNTNKNLLKSSKKFRQFELEQNFLNKIFNLNNIKFYNGYAYVLSSVGVFKININSRIKIVDYYPVGALSFFVNSENEMYVQIPYSSAYKLDATSNFNTVTHYPLDNKNNPRDVFDFFQLDNKLYGISRFAGIYTFDKNQFKSYYKNKLILEKEFTVASQISNNELLLSNHNGDIFSFKPHEDNFSFTKIVSIEELIGTTVKSLEMYGDHLIIGTNLGLNIINTKTRTKRFYDEEQGLNAKSISNTFIFNDTLFITSKTGLDKVDLNKLINKKPEKIQFLLDKLEINDTIFNANNKSILKLSAQQNNLKFSLGVSGLKYPEKLSYRYVIKGLKDAKWSDWTQWEDQRLIKIPYLPSGTYSLDVEHKDLYSGTRAISTIISFTINQSFWKSIWFYILTSILITSLIYAVFKYNFKKAYARQRKKYELEKRVREAKSEALSSQMNPHFIFNALSAIQNYVISNDIDNSLTYIDNFSKLIRQTLDYSSKQSISIQQEIDFLKLYVKIQNLRFGNKVKFKVNISDVDRNTRIAPMLMQPIIENCFEHAFNDTILSPTINLSFEQNINFLEVSIEDNGVGYNTKGHKTSKGLQLVKERLSLLHNANQLHIHSSNKCTTILIQLKQG